MKINYSYSRSGDMSAIEALVYGCLAVAVGLGALAALFVPFIVHIVVCVKTNWAAMLIIGLVIPPVGWVHGVGIIFGVWG